MHLDIRGQNFTLTPFLLEHVERRVRCALARFDGRVARVVVRVADVTSPEAGADKRCRITVRMRPVGEIVAEDAGPDLYAAIDVAAKRIRRSVRREVERLRGWTGTPPRASKTIRRPTQDWVARSGAPGSQGAGDGQRPAAADVGDSDGRSGR